MREAGYYTPYEIAHNMRAAQKVYSGVSLEAATQNEQLFADLETFYEKRDFPDTILSIQPVGSRVRGYHRVESDLDVHIAGTVYDDIYFTRCALDQFVRERYGIHVLHGLNGFIDPDEGLSTHIYPSDQQFISGLRTRPSQFSFLFETGGYTAPAFSLARLACLETLSGKRALPAEEVPGIWQAIQESFVDNFVNGRPADEVCERIHDGFPRFVDLADFIAENQKFRYLAHGGITDLAFPEYVEESEFHANLSTDLEAHISETLLQERAEAFGLSDLLDIQ